MAAAGFVYYGQKGSLDCVICPWCSWTPADWEHTDDPLYVVLSRQVPPNSSRSFQADIPRVTHREKKPNCPFFTISFASQPEPHTKSKPKASRATKGKRATTLAASQAESIADPGDIAESIIVTETEAAAPIKKGRKPRGTAATVTSTSTATRAPRGRGKKAAVAESVAESQAEDELETQLTEPEPIEEEKPKRRGRPKKTDMEASQASQAKEPVAEIDAEAGPVKKGRKPRATKAKAGKKDVAPQEEEATGGTGSEVEIPQDEQEEEAQSTPKAVPAKSKSSRTSKAVPPPAPPVSNQQSEGSRPTTKTNQTSRLPDDSVVALTTISTSTSSRSRPIAGKPRPKSKSTSTSDKALPALPPPSEPSLTPRSQPLNALAQFSNIPPTSPIPQPEISLSPSQKQAKSFRQAMVGFAITSSPQPSGSLSAVQKAGQGEEEKWVEAELSEEEKKMTLEEFMRREVAERVGRMERDGKEMIRLWKEQAERARREIEQAL